MDRLTLGVASLALLELPIEQVINEAAEAGLDGIELTDRAPHLGRDRGPAEAAQVAERATAAGMEMLAFGSYLGHPQASEPGHVERALAVLAATGTARLRVWAALPNFDDTVAFLRQVGQRAVAAGAGVVVERHDGGWADTSPRVERLLDAVGHPAVSLNWQPLDTMTAGEAADLPADAARLGPRTGYTHVKSYGPPAEAGGPVRPWAPVAGGVVDWPATLAASRAAGATGPVAIEMLGGATLAATAAYLRALS